MSSKSAQSDRKEENVELRDEMPDLQSVDQLKLEYCHNLLLPLIFSEKKSSLTCVQLSLYFVVDLELNRRNHFSCAALSWTVTRVEG